MGLQDFFTWRPKTSATSPSSAEEDLVADVDEPPDNQIRRDEVHTEFQKSLIRPQNDRKVSLLTKAFHAPPEHETELSKSDMHITTDLTRRRSMMSNASIASTAELTSDGGLTSPARTNTPSPPSPSTPFSHYTLGSKTAAMPATTKMIGHTPLLEVMGVSPQAQPVVQAPKKRCISFVCDGKKEAAAKAAKEAAIPVVEKPSTPPTTVVPAPRKCTIKFACPGPKSSVKPAKEDAADPPLLKSSEPPKRTMSRSPSLPRKSPRQVPRSTPRDTTTAGRRTSQSPVAVRVKPRYIIADEQTINNSEATRFHEFASEEVRDDDWIRRDGEIVRSKITINDTLKKENAIRQLGNEAEAEALEDEEEEEDDEDDEETQNGNDSDNEDDEDEEEDDDRDSVDYSDDSASDGNESDNEAGFADSDESDAEGEFNFWTPGKRMPGRSSIEALAYRPSAHRTASTSSIDSLNHMEPEAGPKRLRRRPIKIRPGTPDLPDSTDFVCGTLDEDRPLEDAYVSCMEARKNARHKQTPQDIDPSFPTSDPEDEEDEVDAVGSGHDSDEPIWLHGKFEESEDDQRYGRRRSTTMRRKSPAPSPRRFHSPPTARRLHSPPPKQRHHSPPPKQRLRSPPPRKLFGHSPKRMHSPPAAQTGRSPAASPTSTKGITFAPLGSRPGLTHTKSLPRTPNAFCRAYHASRLIAANGNATEGNENTDGHVRGAIDIVKGLEKKRQRRKEKYNQKQCNRKNKGHSDRKPPLRGSERMRELGLLMAGKTGQHDPYMLSA
ncbi:uncharacterized protein RAG0_11600 [Rhynchosporium agropyri]|uniref:Uncharacterized protein n=1 Tax=Rhynchosporium agropyri TaxID=914238 RepID=A0A1E1L4Z9_9HELO|nr:uncharacterized protein RAG0_11600 [Rhynchosporium agropyri]